MPDDPISGRSSSFGLSEFGNPLTWRSPRLLWTSGNGLVLDNGAIALRANRPNDGRMVTPGFNLIRDFVGLARSDVGEDQILAFARAWGLLGLCPHGLPRTHDQNLIPFSMSGGFELTGDWHCLSGMGDSETVAWWRYWAGQARALVEVIAALRGDKLGSITNWETLWRPGPWAHGASWDRGLGVFAEVQDRRREFVLADHGYQREQVAGTLQRWLALGGVMLEFHWRSEHPTVALGNSGLFATIGLLLLSLVDDLEGLALCRGCQALMLPNRRLGRHDHAQWCPACRAEGRSKRAANQARYRRRAADISFLAAEAARRREARAQLKLR